MCIVKNCSVSNQTGECTCDGTCPLFQMQMMGERKKTTEEQHLKDILYQSTALVKVVFRTLDDIYTNFKRSPYHKVFNTTQPAHFITVLSITTICFLVYPNDEPNHPSKLWNFLHLAAFCIHFGAQIWMTFVSGLALYFTLPRHDFGEVQKVLFPKYFLLNSMLSFTTLVIFLRYHNSSLGQPEILVQAVVMATCFITELVIRLYFTPSLLKLMEAKNKMEKRAGSGSEIGELNAGHLVTSIDYLKVHKAFRKIHMKIAMGNIVTMICTVMHLHYLSTKISV